MDPEYRKYFSSFEGLDLCREGRDKPRIGRYA